MKQQTFIWIFSLFLTTICTWIISCKQKDTSEIEKIIVDKEFIKLAIAEHDSISIDSANEFKNIKTVYFFNDSSTVTFYTDSLHRIRGWFKHKKGKRIEGAEVHAKTGQICGKLNFVDGEIEGEVKYYYEDGRVKSKGLFKNGTWWGVWKNYDKDGNFISLMHY